MTKISKRLEDCYDWELNDQIIRFDAIVESMMTTDVARDKLRQEFIDWQDDVANMVDELSESQPYEGYREFAAMAEELFGTEV
tara:strand:- start:370 stop:618 length:249 start_codon:yes stop_codon:yes gene_type:complete